MRSKSFIGCLRDLIIDGQRSDLSSYIANQGSIEGCSSMNDHCNKRCSNGGICVNKFDGFECSCKDGTSGEKLVLPLYLPTALRFFYRILSKFLD